MLLLSLLQCYPEAPPLLCVQPLAQCLVHWEHLCDDYRASRHPDRAPGSGFILCAEKHPVVLSSLEIQRKHAESLGFVKGVTEAWWEIGGPG